MNNNTQAVLKHKLCFFDKGEVISVISLISKRQKSPKRGYNSLLVIKFNSLITSFNDLWTIMIRLATEFSSNFFQTILFCEIARDKHFTHAHGWTGIRVKLEAAFLRLRMSQCDEGDIILYKTFVSTLEENWDCKRFRCVNHNVIIYDFRIVDKDILKKNLFVQFFFWPPVNRWVTMTTNVFSLKLSKRKWWSH